MLAEVMLVLLLARFQSMRITSLCGEGTQGGLSSHPHTEVSLAIEGRWGILFASSRPPHMLQVMFIHV